MRVGIICPYSFDIPGGVQAHVLDLAAALRKRGHYVEVLGPGDPQRVDRDGSHWAGVTFTGKSFAIPYNGSVARLSFGYRSRKAVKHWLERGDFDVLHIHEPNAPSLGLLALLRAHGPIVATFHTSATESRALKVVEGFLAPRLEKIRGRIAVSALARRWQMEALGSDAVEIPNGVDVEFYRARRSRNSPMRGRELSENSAFSEPTPASEPTVVFVGRYDEPRKGLPVLLAALPQVYERHPGLRVRIIGSGDERAARSLCSEGEKIEFCGGVTDSEKAEILGSADIYCAPNTGGESFGIVLVEAMSAGAAVVASDLDAFRRVLENGSCGALVPVGNSDALAETICRLIEDPVLRSTYVQKADSAVLAYDWSVVAERVLRVYDIVRSPGEKVSLR